jgi:hypothetical protein
VIGRPPKAAIERLFDRVKVLENGCWVREGNENSGRYGKMLFEGKTTQAHVVSYVLHKGPVPPGCLVRHTCDNPPCRNPDHLVAGTQKQNCQDAVSRDRHSRGSRNGLAKLDEETVVQLRARLKESDTVLAKEFGVSRAAVWFIRKNLHWRHAA